MRGFFSIFLLFVAASNALAAAAPEAPQTLDDAIERLRLQLVSASDYTSPWDSLNPRASARKRYLEFANSLLYAKRAASDEETIERLHDLIPRITTLSTKELIEPHTSVSNAVVELHEHISHQYDLPDTKDYYIAHTPLMLTRGGERTVTIHGNFKTINANHEPTVSIEGREVSPIDVTDTDIVFEVPEDLLEQVDDLWFSIVAGRSFRPLELILIRKTIRDKRRLFVRSENALVGTVEWFVPDQAATQSFTGIVERSVNRNVTRPTRVSESLDVAELVDLSVIEVMPETEFDELRIAGLRWNSKISDMSEACERPSTSVRWSSRNVTMSTRVLPRREVATKRKTYALTRSPAQRYEPRTACEVEVRIFLAPEFEGLLPGAEIGEFHSESEIMVAPLDTFILEPPHPAFWRGVLVLQYEAGPLSFFVRTQISSLDEPRVIELPGWRVSLQTDTPEIKYLAID